MSINIEKVASQYGLFLCVECGKCVAVCPMSEIFDDFSYEVSPRGIIGSISVGEGIEVLNAERFWFCLTCDLCTNLCPTGVRFRDFVTKVRFLAIESGITEHGSFCQNCSKYLWPWHTMRYLKQILGEGAEELLTLCPKCRQYNLGEKVKELESGNRKGDSREVLTGDGL